MPYFCYPAQRVLYNAASLGTVMEMATSKTIYLLDYAKVEYCSSSHFQVMGYFTIIGMSIMVLHF